MSRDHHSELPTLWEIPDLLWDNLIAPLLAEFDPPRTKGRRRADPRRCLNGILYRARTGCQWNHLPAEFGDDATVHRTLKRWEEQQIFDRLWALLIYHCEELQAVHWEWQAADGCLNKARFIGKKGAKAQRRASELIYQPKKSQEKVLVLTPVTEEKWASRSACLSRETAARLLSASQERM
jgi:transposase